MLISKAELQELRQEIIDLKAERSRLELMIRVLQDQHARLLDYFNLHEVRINRVELVSKGGPEK